MTITYDCPQCGAHTATQEEPNLYYCPLCDDVFDEEQMDFDRKYGSDPYGDGNPP